MTPKLYTLELTETERDMLRDFWMSYFSDYAYLYRDEYQQKQIAESLYNKIDNLDPEEVGAS
jgi:hypothetical protein